MAKRLQVDLSESDYDRLRQMAKGRPLADVVRRALSTEAYVERRREDGARLIIEEKDGSKKELIAP